MLNFLDTSLRGPANNRDVLRVFGAAVRASRLPEEEGIMDLSWAAGIPACMLPRRTRSSPAQPAGQSSFATIRLEPVAGGRSGLSSTGMRAFGHWIPGTNWGRMTRSSVYRWR
ncbi:hypothetical protein K523DRAFT_43786 [Schizophyllum commune Tattone D]|nr:hypothetical protein K523DRAFT_43786 [Schizophyllum commune Tattone D]